MTCEIYTCNRYKSFGAFEYLADFSEPSSPISVRFPHLDTEGDWTDEDGWEPIPYQVAEAGTRKRVEQLIVEHFK